MQISRAFLNYKPPQLTANALRRFCTVYIESAGRFRVEKSPIWRSEFDGMVCFEFLI